MFTRIIRSIAIALGALSLSAPVAGAMVAGGPGYPSETVPAVTSHLGGSDASQRRAGESTLVAAADRSDAAQRTPGQTPAVGGRLVPASHPVATDDGFDWTLAGICAALVLLASGVAIVPKRRRVAI